MLPLFFVPLLCYISLYNRISDELTLSTGKVSSSVVDRTGSGNLGCGRAKIARLFQRRRGIQRKTVDGRDPKSLYFKGLTAELLASWAWTRRTVIERFQQVSNAAHTPQAFRLTIFDGIDDRPEKRIAGPISEGRQVKKVERMRQARCRRLQLGVAPTYRSFKQVARIAPEYVAREARNLDNRLNNRCQIVPDEKIKALFRRSRTMEPAK